MNLSSNSQVELVLKRLRRRPQKVAAFEYFEQVLCAGPAPGRRPLVGQLCRFVPEELVLAAGAHPLRLDLGGRELEEGAEKHFPVEACCAARAFVGAWEEKIFPIFENLDLLVIPACCDAKKRLAALLSSPKVFVLQPPPENQSAAARKWWLEQILALKGALEKIAGKKIKRQALFEAAQLLNRRAAAVRKLNELRARDPAVVSGTDALMVMQAAFFDQPQSYTEKLEELVGELEKLQPLQKRSTIPLVLSGSPLYWPEFSLPLLAEECGAQLVADDLCSAAEFLRHPVLSDENSLAGFLEGAADRTLLTTICPIFSANTRRTENLIELVRSTGARGVIYHVLYRCLPFDAEQITVTRALKEAGIAVLTLRCVFGEEEARLKTRLEAFLEMLSSGQSSIGTSS